MHFAEQDHGDYRVYGGALDSRDGTYKAAMVVVRLRGHRNQPEVVYRDERVSSGHAFETAEAALKRAMDAGRVIVRSRFEPSSAADPTVVAPHATARALGRSAWA